MIQKYLFLDLFDGFDLVLQDKSLQSGLIQLSMMSIKIVENPKCKQISEKCTAARKTCQ
jgi:hypothetical protein